MKKTTILWAFVIIFLVTALLTIGINIINREKPYKTLENDIIEAMQIYYGQDSNLKKLPTAGDKINITVEELKNFGIDLNMNINNDQCYGYGVVTGKTVGFGYEAFIKCENYTTKNYNYIVD